MNRPILNETTGGKKYPIFHRILSALTISLRTLAFLMLFSAITPLLAQTPKFYGLTSKGGKDGTGAIIEYDINSQTLTDPAPTGFTNFSPGKPLYNDLINTGVNVKFNTKFSS